MAQRQVRNQFNITSSYIGQMSVANKGPTVFNRESKHFEAGSKDIDVKISGGHFPQANIGGEATYNNKGGAIGGMGEGSNGAGKTGLTLTEILRGGSRETEKAVLSILKSGIDENSLMSILRNGKSITSIEAALRGCTRGNLDNMIQSMLLSHDSDSSSDSD